MAVKGFLIADTRLMWLCLFSVCLLCTDRTDLENLSCLLCMYPTV